MARCPGVAQAMGPSSQGFSLATVAVSQLDQGSHRLNKCANRGQSSIKQGTSAITRMKTYRHLRSLDGGRPDACALEGAVEGSAEPEEAIAQESVGGKHVFSLELKETHDHLALQQPQNTTCW